MDFSAIDNFINENEENIIADLASLVAIPSKRAAAAEGKPFGEACAAALAEMKKKADDTGLKTKNYDNYMLECDYNGEETALGIIAHLDVVPEGDGWSGDPFKLERRGEAVFGRGAIDDKGPAVAVLWAVKALKAADVQLSKNVRLLFGSDEETGMQDLEHYRSIRPLPKMMLSPDGEFPVINVEKGVCQFAFSRKYAPAAGLLSIKAGSVVNAVPDKAEAVVSGISAAEAERAASAAGVSVSFAFADCAEGLRISAQGASAHGSTPEKGDNALTGLMKLLLELPLPENELLSAVKALYELFPYGEGDGTAMGLKMSDEQSGALTALLSLFSTDNETAAGAVDIRFPATVKLAAVEEIVKNKLQPLGFELDFNHVMEGHLVPADSDFIKTLLDCYTAVTGQKGGCLSEGGATYLHTVEGGVAYGAEMPGEENNMHGADEHIKVETLLNIVKIYARAIYELCR